MPGQHLVDDLAHPHVGALLEALDQADHRDPGPQFGGEVLEHTAEAVAGHTHDDDVGAVGGLAEIGGGAQGFRQLHLVAEVAGVAVVVVDVVGGLLRAHPLQGRHAAGTDGCDGGAPGASAEHDDFGFAAVRCHGDQGIAGVGCSRGVWRGGFRTGSPATRRVHGRRGVAAHAGQSHIRTGQARIVRFCVCSRGKSRSLNWPAAGLALVPREPAMIGRSLWRGEA